MYPSPPFPPYGRKYWESTWLTLQRQGYKLATLDSGKSQIQKTQSSTTTFTGDFQDACVDHFGRETALRYFCEWLKRHRLAEIRAEIALSILRVKNRQAEAVQVPASNLAWHRQYGELTKYGQLAIERARLAALQQQHEQLRDIPAIPENLSQFEEELSIPESQIKLATLRQIQERQVEERQVVL